MKQQLSLILALVLVSCNTTQLPAPGLTETPPNFFAETSVPLQTEHPVTETPSPTAWPSFPTPTLQINVPLKAGQNINVTSIQMIDKQNGWGLDTDHHILHTSDRGISWQDVTPPEGFFEPKGFFALNADTAWATFTHGAFSMPTSAFVWRTTDAGKIWTPSEPFFLNIDSTGLDVPVEFYLPREMQFIDSQTGWLFVIVYYGMNSTRPLLLHTTDGGAAWKTINDRDHGMLGTWGCITVGFAFADTQTGWVGANCIEQGVIYNALETFFPSGGWVVYKTTDAGNNFDQKTILPLPTALQDPDKANDGAVCGETKVLPIASNTIGIEWKCRDYTQKRDYIFFALTSDNGQTWSTWESAGNEYFLDSKLGWRLFSPGMLQHTTDGGLTWTTIKSVAWETAQFDFVSEQLGWAVVGNDNVSTLVHTTDGGSTWTEIKPIIAP